MSNKAADKLSKHAIQCSVHAYGGPTKRHQREASEAREIELSGETCVDSRLRLMVRFTGVKVVESDMSVTATVAFSGRFDRNETPVEDRLTEESRSSDFHREETKSICRSIPVE
jgi:hypothetical protein